MAGDDRGPSPWARRLGYGGLVPFVGLAAAGWVAPPADSTFATAALLGYGATIASFLGGIHWGLLMRPGAAQPLPILLWGVMPSLLGWLALLLEPAPGLVLLAMLLWLSFAVDRSIYPRHQMQAWLPMRLRLTLVASASCLAAAVALQR